MLHVRVRETILFTTPLVIVDKLVADFFDIVRRTVEREQTVKKVFAVKKIDHRALLNADRLFLVTRAVGSGHRARGVCVRNASEFPVACEDSTVNCGAYNYQPLSGLQSRSNNWRLVEPDFFVLNARGGSVIIKHSWRDICCDAAICMLHDGNA